MQPRNKNFIKKTKEISSNIKQGFEEGWGKVGQRSAALLPSTKYGTVPAMLSIRLNDHENVKAEKKTPRILYLGIRWRKTVNVRKEVMRLGGQVSLNSVSTPNIPTAAGNPTASSSPNLVTFMNEPSTITKCAIQKYLLHSVCRSVTVSTSETKR